MHRKSVEHFSETDGSAPGLAENSAPDRRVIVPRFGACAVEQRAIAVFEVHELEDAPRAGRVGDADHRKSRTLCRAFSYAARASSTVRIVDTSATGTSHHES